MSEETIYLFAGLPRSIRGCELNFFRVNESNKLTARTCSIFWRIFARTIIIFYRRNSMLLQYIRFVFSRFWTNRHGWKFCFFLGYNCWRNVCWTLHVFHYALYGLKTDILTWENGLQLTKIIFRPVSIVLQSFIVFISTYFMFDWLIARIKIFSCKVWKC